MVISRLSGMGAWLGQRLSAIYMALYLPVYASVIWSTVHGYEDWVSFNRHPVVAVADVLFFGALLLHSWVGVRDVILDYAKPITLRAFLLASVGLFLAIMGFWLLRIYIQLSVT